MKRVLPLVFLLSSTSLGAQTFLNPSMEGTPTLGVPPTGWLACGFLSTPDTQPGSYNVITPAFEGSTYISLVTRGTESPSGVSTESVLGQMDKPFEAGVEYTFTISLAYSKDFTFDDGFGTLISYSNPAKLRVYTGTSSCDHSEFIWESPVIDHTEWRTYVMKFTTTRESNPLIQFEANYASGDPYPGNILIDNVQIDPCSIARPIQTIAFEKNICKGDSVVLDATTPGGKYFWADGKTTPAITVREAGTFVVDVSNGCTHQVFAYVVTTSECVCPLSYPNVFTPNDDGWNDSFQIVGSGDVARYQLKIYNRWGEEVFASANINEAWDGRVKGTSTQGIYYWIADVQCVYNKVIIDGNYKGWVSLVK